MKKLIFMLCLAFFICLPARAEAAAPKAPLLTSAKAASGGITVTWKKCADASGYAVYRSEVKAKGYKTWKKITSKNTTSWKDTTAIPGTTYYYRVRAYKKSGSKTLWSKYSAIKSAKISGKPVRLPEIDLGRYGGDSEESFEYDAWLKMVKSKIVAIKKGSMTLVARRGLASFKADKAGKYTFTYSNLRTIDAGAFDYNLGYILFPSEDFDVEKEYRKTFTMEGKKASSIRIASPDAATSGKTTADWILKRSAVLTLKKGQTVYLYHDLGFGYTVSAVNLTIS